MRTYLVAVAMMAALAMPASAQLNTQQQDFRRRASLIRPPEGD
jgi:hypothetical protein